ncbi:RnfABCDGE type electron transport complex subunit D [Anaerotignum lactatifermentans]|uniref:Ion-translocating oxidoreductase complex subunit D n=1 Tax=Anaerotignum lactatifermentans TaxID=160404 RepID=A0ABS2GAC7_9FIRM|nr:RnfABCDGE type electron transport complex subunit D [Anaerotignum lactatifermentans]MBM6829921.1 RnfABCDGE type electron transport complex subunit D [Anaerotignum lactatifermentans]MBM6878424.1 RnfABCDGE type electron transport complex subunit D [Anaerotignum lactatifermentans]MBM6951578.1 RnfABCDGE type electron transport complex subunit D [Anaerotignum lactatifermentans]
MSNFVVSGTPHVRSKESIQSIMRDVIIALIPATAVGIYYFGIPALITIVVAIVSSVFFEWLYQKAMKKPVTVSDLSAVVTGLLLAMNLPASAPIWVPIVGSAFAIIFAKQLFGGLGQNFINPALAGRAFLVASYPTEMTAWTAPVGFSGADAVAVATPLATLKGGAMPDASLLDVVVGNIGGCIGETCAIALIAGGIYLIVKHVISWKIPVIYIATVFILTAAIGRKGLRVPVYELFTGGLMLGAFFMATDYASSPVTPKGQVIFAIGCGLITTLIRIFGGYPEGVSYSILIMNLAVPLIERFTEPKIFGALPKVKEAKKA